MAPGARPLVDCNSTYVLRDTVTILCLGFSLCQEGTITQLQSLTPVPSCVYAGPAALDAACFWVLRICLWSACVLLERLPPQEHSAHSLLESTVQTSLQEVLPCPELGSMRSGAP